MSSFLTFCGSIRKDSLNQKTLDCVSRALHAQGASVSNINLRDYAVPLYYGDEEDQHGLPEATRQFQALLHQHDALVIGCPEYNGFMTPLLINTIDWATRSDKAAPDLSGFRDKPVLITSCSPGALGGMRAATHLRTMLSGIGCIVSPGNFMVPTAFSAFDQSGALKDEALQKRADQTAQKFLELTSRLVE